MKRSIRHLRHHAYKHREAHQKLKDLIGRPFQKERLWPLFLGTFIATIAIVTILINWESVTNFFSAPPSHSSAVEISVSHQDSSKETLQNILWLTHTLSTGQHLTHLQQGQAKALQKSILSTYYLGEKTIDINSTLQNDSKILSQINNALSVDLFQYLNQADNRSDALDEYLHLLDVLQRKTEERIRDLNSKIIFLSANFQSRESQIQLSEGAFFDQLKIFQGPNAEEELGKFIGLQEGQAEIRAKMGAYEGLKGYYEFFQPKLDNLIRAIKANRGPLIAGVKVVEIQNMTLPLIIEQQ